MQTEAMKKVSVIIPVYNDNNGVDSLIISLRRQKYSLEYMEIIIVDNGSNPRIRLSNFQEIQIRLIRCETPGSYAARNAGVKAASGEILAFIDADCQPEENWLNNAVEALLNGDETYVIGGEVKLIKPKHPTAVALYQCATGFGQESNILEKSFSATANLLCTRKQFEFVGPFDERLLSGGDREWCWRANKLGIEVKFEPNAIVFTHPRTSFGGAARQARRVVAGRKRLRELGLAHVGDTAVAKQKSAIEALIWIISNSDLNPLDRFRVLLVAGLIRVISAFESLRLALGAKAERS